MSDAPSDDLSAATIPSVDSSALARLERFGGRKLLVEMIALFEAAGPQRVAAARAGLVSGDTSATELALHSLKSSSAQLGAVRLGRLSEAGENVTRLGSFDGVPQILDSMDSELAAVLVWLAAAREKETA